MLEFHRVLIPVDFSEHSRRSLARCSQIFSGSATREFHLVYVWRPPVDATIWEDPREELESGLSDFVEDFDPGVDHQRELHCLLGQPALEVCRYAREKECDLIALATHGRTGLPHLFIGSTAEQVVRHAPCPVLVLPASELGN